MKKIMLVFLFTACASVGFSQEQNSTVIVRNLLEELGSYELAISSIKRTAESMKEIQSDLPPEFWERLLERFDKKSFYTLLIPIYQKNFTEQELLELTAFYKTPLGKKLSEKLPILMQEANEAGKKFGEKLGKEVAEELFAEKENQTTPKATPKSKTKKK